VLIIPPAQQFADHVLVTDHEALFQQRFERGIASTQVPDPDAGVDEYHRVAFRSMLSRAAGGPRV
jgi:hypothetical protein